MANTVIQLKFSTVTATPTSLNVAEPAYSYTSNTLFIGSPAGTGSIAIGGKFYLDQQQNIYNLTNAAFTAANAAGSSAFVQAAFNHANSSFIQANAAFGVANTASDRSLSAGIYANGAFAAANSANATDLTQNNSITAAFIAANSAGIYANGAFAAANAANATDTTQNNSIIAAFTTANSAAIYANGAFTAANSAGVYANGAFARANNSLNANTGGTVTGSVTISDGDLIVSGNLIINGNTTTHNVSSLNIADPLIYLAANNYSSDIVDIGFVGSYYDAGTPSLRHAGFFRDASDGTFYVFNNYQPEPINNVIDIANSSFRVATLNANIVSQTVTVRGVEVLTFAQAAFNAANGATAIDVTQNNSIIAAFTAANSAGVYANGAFESANSAGRYANGAFTTANTASDRSLSAGIYANGAFVSANSAGIYANGAFAAANAASTQSAATDLTQNNSITAAFAAANTASIYANGAFAKANTDVTNISIVAADYGSATRTSSFKLEANGRISTANSTLIALDASQITSGTLGVGRGGTGNTSLQNNAVLLGQGTSAITAVGSTVEGHVLTINSSGVPRFEHISGGTF